MRKKKLLSQLPNSDLLIKGQRLSQVCHGGVAVSSPAPRLERCRFESKLMSRGDEMPQMSRNIDEKQVYVFNDK